MSDPNRSIDVRIIGITNPPSRSRVSACRICFAVFSMRPGLLMFVVRAVIGPIKSVIRVFGLSIQLVI